MEGEPVLSARPAAHADWMLCWQVFRQTMRPCVEATWGWDEPDQRRRFETSFDPVNRRIIELAGEPIGVLHLEVEPTPVRLLNLQILPPSSGKGMAPPSFSW